ncbi:MAG: arginine--tRNA ligase [Clostridia bacterium]|nr:arginine--tRNA ligase [Clostridia bacterium]
MKEQKEKIAGFLAEVVEGLSREEITGMIEIPPDTTMGDFAFPCFKLAKTMRKAPQMIAEDIAGKFAGNEMFSEVRNVNAYVNFFLNRPAAEADIVSRIVAEKEAYGGSGVGQGKTVCIDYSSPNIAKPFHIGHIRSTVIGNSLYKIFDFLGYDVVRINHLGDYGTQFGKMIVAYRKWGNHDDVVREPIKSLLSYYVKFHEEAEKDPALEDEARATFKKLEDGAPEEQELWQWFRDESLKEFNYVYDLLGIRFDSYAGESFYSDKLQAALDKMENLGILEESQGATVVNLEEENLPPALIKKNDGSTLYITRDIAAALYRHDTYDFDKCIYVVASQQNLHFRQLFTVLERMGCDWAKGCVHVPFGMVSLEDGTMSTRKGKVVFLLDVLQNAVEKTREIIREKSGEDENFEETAKAVGIGAVVFQELSNNRIKDYVFSWDKTLNFDGETGPYVQYTHARAASVLRKAPEDVAEILSGAVKPDMTLVNNDDTYRLMSLIGRFPDAVQEAADKYEPSVVTRHIIDIAQLFNKFYHDVRVIVDDKAERQAKLAVVIAAKQTIANGLALLGVAAPEKM